MKGRSEKQCLSWTPSTPPLIHSSKVNRDFRQNVWGSHLWKLCSELYSLFFGGVCHSAYWHVAVCMPVQLFQNTNLDLAVLINKFNHTLNIWYVFSAGKLNKIWEQEDESEKERTKLCFGFNTYREGVS